MNTWFKTINNLLVNKFAYCILNPQTPASSFELLLDLELKGKLPLSMMVEHPSKDVKSLTIPLKGKTYLSMMEWGLLAKNYNFLNWILTKEYVLTNGDIKLFLNHFVQDQVKKEPVSPEMITFMNTLLAKLPADGMQIAGVKSSSSFPYYLIKHLPVELCTEIIKANPPKMADFYNMTVQTFKEVWAVHKDKFPYLQAIEQFEGKTVGFIQGNELSPVVLDSLGILAGQAKLKDGVEQLFQTKSKEVLKIVDTKVFPRSGKQVTLDGEYLNYLLFLKTIFNPDTNTSDFVEYLEGKKMVNLANEFNAEYQVIMSRLLNSFTNPQKKNLLDSWSGRLQFREALNLFNSYPTYFQNLLSETEFKEINTFTKLRDFMVNKAEVASVELVNLCQETHFPTVTEMLSMQLPEDFTIVIAQTNHELIKWGVDMDHCIGGSNYQNDAAKGRCLLIALAKKGVPKYAVEVRNRRVVQVQGKSGTDPKNKLLTTCLYKALEHCQLIER